jgi:hypothetical protein
VLQEHDQIGESASISEVVTRMRAIDTSACPTDFRMAYLKHIHAWEEERKVELEAKKLGEPDGFWDAVPKYGRAMSLKGASDSASEETIQTYQEIEKVAVFRRAKLPNPKQDSE